MSEYIYQHQQEILALPIFNKVGEQTVDNILKYAKITQLTKGSIIFTQGLNATKFYILLSGLVKLFKSNQEGDEAVLKVLKAQDNLCETILFHSQIFPLSAEAISDIQVLVIPINIIRSYLQSSHALALNILDSMSKTQLQFITKFEQLSIKTATERVGWFLLKLFIEQKQSKTLVLPYDKSLIAQSLGMAPETFSRALQELKIDGININKNIVTLPETFALSHYCNLEIASSCNLHGTAACPNPKCT